MIYLVTLNYSGELHRFYTQASGEDRAVSNAITRLSGKLGVPRFIVNYKVKVGSRVTVKEVRDESSKE